MAGGADTKVCEVCGDEFIRANRITNLRWTTQRFCGASCRTEHLNEARWNDQAAELAKIIASETLLKRLLRYGLRHDGLPGLPANDLLRLAKLHRVTA